jgi:hypothetical protein
MGLVEAADAIDKLSEEDLERFQSEFNEIRGRLQKRRETRITKNLKYFHSFPHWQSTVGILCTVDTNTSGRFCWLPKERTIAFQYGSDLTAFMLAYHPSPP